MSIGRAVRPFADQSISLLGVCQFHVFYVFLQKGVISIQLVSVNRVSVITPPESHLTSPAMPNWKVQLRVDPSNSKAQNLGKVNRCWYRRLVRSNLLLFFKFTLSKNTCSVVSKYDLYINSSGWISSVCVWRRFRNPGSYPYHDTFWQSLGRVRYGHYQV